MQIPRIQPTLSCKSRAWLSVCGKMLFSALMLALLPLAAWAQEDNDEKIQVDPATAAQQNRIIGTILVVIIVFVAWYYLRRWQITRKSNRPPDDHKKD